LVKYILGPLEYTSATVCVYNCLAKNCWWNVGEIDYRKKRRERIRKNRKKQKLIAQLAKIETELDVYNGNLDFTNDDDNKDKDKNNDNVYNYELNYSNYDELLNLNVSFYW